MKCSHEGCAIPGHAKGYCRYHYNLHRLRRTPCPTRGMTTVQKLDFYTDKSGGPDACWLWTGVTDEGGYGMLRVEGKMKRAHRVRWGDPGGLQVLHSCDTPGCNNPRHLFLGTPASNAMDKARKGRGNRTKLTAAQALRIRDGGESPVALAKEFEVNVTTIYDICSGDTWNHLEEKANAIGAKLKALFADD